VTINNLGERGRDVCDQLGAKLLHPRFPFWVSDSSETFHTDYEISDYTMDYSCRICYISEILRAILDNLADDKRSMASLALSSKAVSGAALDYLWADMDSFHPFVPLLPTPVQEIWVSHSCNTRCRKLRYC